MNKQSQLMQEVNEERLNTIKRAIKESVKTIIDSQEKRNIQTVEAQEAIHNLEKAYVTNNIQDMEEAWNAYKNLHRHF